MSKYLKIVVTTLAAVALAAPAFATSSVSGYYRMQMITQTINGARPRTSRPNPWSTTACAWPTRTS